MNPLLGIFSVYILYCLAAIIQQTILTTPYLSSQNYEYKYFPYSIGFVIFPSLTSWVIGFVLNMNNDNKVHISNTSSFKCGLLIFISSLSFSKALYYGSYPISVMLRSYNIVPIAIISIFFTKSVIHEKIKKQKIIYGILTTVSIIIFIFSRSSANLQKQNTPLNLLLILLSLFADGFINIYQNQIKYQQKPKGLQMYEQFNKWKLLLCVSYLLITFQATDFIKYFYYNKKCLYHFIFYSLASSIGELIVYWLIGILRNNVVPFIVSTRKITTVLLSIILFTHYLSLLQIGAVLLMYITMVCNFFKEINVQKNQEKQAVRSAINNMTQGQSFVRDHQQF